MPLPRASASRSETAAPAKPAPCGGSAFYCDGGRRFAVADGHYSSGGDANTRTAQRECGSSAFHCANGLRHGQGTERRDGDTYEGAWVEDLRHGYGVAVEGGGAPCASPRQLKPTVALTM